MREGVARVGHDSTIARAGVRLDTLLDVTRARRWTVQPLELRQSWVDVIWAAWRDGDASVDVEAIIEGVQVQGAARAADDEDGTLLGTSPLLGAPGAWWPPTESAR